MIAIDSFLYGYIKYLGYEIKVNLAEIQNKDQNHKNCYLISAINNDEECNALYFEKHQLSSALSNILCQIFENNDKKISLQNETKEFFCDWLECEGYAIKLNEIGDFYEICVEKADEKYQEIVASNELGYGFVSILSMVLGYKSKLNEAYSEIM